MSFRANYPKREMLLASVERGSADSIAPEAFLFSALNEVEPGLIILSKDFQAEFINRAFYRMWALPLPPDGVTYDFASIMEHGRRTGLYVTQPGSLDDYVRQRRGRIRLSDGRVLKFECKTLPGGRHLMAFTDISDFIRTADKLRELATIDDLTRIPNRRQFLNALDVEFVRAQRNDRDLSVLMIDVDYFKGINDRYGHFAGDDVLRELALRLQTTIRHTDLLGRLGGEEFAIALKDTAMPAALETAERLCLVIADKPFHAAGGEIKVTASVGVAERMPQDDNPAELLRLADEALFRAKMAGRNGVVASRR